MAARSAARRAVLAAVDWAAARRDYESGEGTVAGILRRYAVSVHELRVVRVAQGWATRPPAAKPGPLRGRRPAGVKTCGLRLRKLLAGGIEKLDRRIARRGLTEETARMLAELCRAGETIMRATKRTAGPASGGEKKAKDVGADASPIPDAAQLRAELKARLARFRESRGSLSGGGRGEPGGGAGG